ncbi:unnamed protein product [Sordaria macrospora k-hell]|uniref:WGS project CABT00000000 data, contig 2.41 n=1 Tax=Sordaria macrospora (strain ATCC MYA-333 / DSM 997 / K(L3346) / K-hell) TaxID=771870 RepID=F7W7V3_SORMK|nr:uncharacterized protein SMAC_12783 [Sordaria macrospora k-hell]CCC13596.1 unnamed protein product [Sordaria macrospora k-hell]
MRPEDEGEVQKGNTLTEQQEALVQKLEETKIVGTPLSFYRELHLRTFRDYEEKPR